MKALHHITGFVLGVLCLCFMACHNNDSSGSPKNEPVVTLQPTPIQAGRAIFEEKCIACHGNDGTAGTLGAANLKTLTVDSIVIAQTVLHGKNSMPAYAALSASEVAQVTTYVKSLHP